MELKMFKFGEDCVYWICAEDMNQASNIYKDTFGEALFYELVACHGGEAVKEEPMDKEFTYYHDGARPEKNTIEYFLKNHCSKPDIFACSEF